MNQDNNTILMCSWQQGFLIPLAQCLVGGFAASSLVAVGALALFTNNADTVQSAALLAGSLVCCGSILLRFFSPELKVIDRAYQAGKASQGHTIEQLEKQVFDLQQLVSNYESTPEIALGSTKNNQQVLDAVADAEKLIAWKFQNKPISRAACIQRGVGQRAWERAKECLHNAGIIHKGKWVISNQAEAQQALSQHYQRRQFQMSQGAMVTPY